MKAYELIDSPDKWYGGRHESYGLCAVTAIVKVYGYASGQHTRLRYHIYGQDGRGLVSQWNDRSDWETVYNTLKALDI